MVRLGDMMKTLPAVIAVAFAAGAFATEIPVLDGAVTAEQWGALPKNFALANCDSAQCATLRSLVTSFTELDARDLPNSMARREPMHVNYEPITVVKRVRSEPKEGDSACGMLSVLARSYFDWSIGLHTVEIASLLEPLRSKCVPEVVEAFPASDETRSLLTNAAEFCRVRKEPACDLIALSHR
jgi:hypothetical protein